MFLLGLEVVTLDGALMVVGLMVGGLVVGGCYLMVAGWLASC